MRTDNDVRLAEKVPEINLILGGHSLVYEKRKVCGMLLALGLKRYIIFVLIGQETNNNYYNTADLF